jgi:adenylyl- and sulfurtransferase ThiI
MLYIIRYSEIGLKGGNRKYFENKLISNIKEFLKNSKIKNKILRLRGRILVETDKKTSFKTIFGIASYSEAIETKNIKKEVKKLIKNFNKNTKFRVTAQRLEKKGKTSLELEREIGAFIVKEKGSKVSLKDYQKNIQIELFNNKAYLFVDKIRCFSGLPVGTEGKVLAIINNEADILAALLMMKRGCEVIATKNNKLLQDYNHKKPLKIINGNYDKIAEENNCKAIITGETDLKEKHLKTIILKPLIAYNKKEIKERLEEFRCYGDHTSYYR